MSSITPHGKNFGNKMREIAKRFSPSSNKIILSLWTEIFKKIVNFRHETRNRYTRKFPFRNDVFKTHFYNIKIYYKNNFIFFYA